MFFYRHSIRINEVNVFKSKNNKFTRPDGRLQILYTESEQDYKLYQAVPLGITHSKYLCSSKSAKNEYTLRIGHKKTYQEFYIPVCT